MVGWQQKMILNPRGSWSLTQEILVGKPARANFCQNVRFSPGKVNSREGTSPAFTASGRVSGMFDWLSPVANLVQFMEGTSLKQYEVATGITDTLATGITGYGPSYADLGPRLYMCAFDTSGNGTVQCRVYDGSGPTGVDKAFSPPLTFSAFTLSDGGAGFCTIGTHQIGFVFQSRSGFAGLPSPAPLNVFTPQSITLNGTNRTIHVSITLNTPADAGPGSFIYPIMTRADAPNGTWYFVPGNSQQLPPSAINWTQTFDISVSDEDLATSAEPATDQFSCLAQTVQGNGPFNPSVVRAYGKRMTYLVSNKVYVSDINDPQFVTEDFHVVQTQGQRQIFTTFQLGASFFMCGDRWTARVTDNGDFPSTWAAPESASDSLGTTAPTGVEWRTAGDYVWVANEIGLFMFDGSYPDKPITYLVSDQWQQINWAAPYAVQVVDNVSSQKVFVAVPTGSATTPTQMFIIDYTNGRTYDSCDISVDVFNPALFASICRVKENTTGRTNVWIGPNAAGAVLRYDATVNSDNGNAIDSIWESSFLREQGELPSEFIRIGGAHLNVLGNGSLTHKWYGRNRVYWVQPTPFALIAQPSQPFYTKFDLNRTDNYTMRLEMSGQATGYWQLSAFKPYYNPSSYLG